MTSFVLNRQIIVYMVQHCDSNGCGFDFHPTHILLVKCILKMLYKLLKIKASAKYNVI